MKYEVGIVDDHQLFSNSLALMLESFRDFRVTIDVNSGKQLQQQIKMMARKPDIILLDVSMPDMSGIACAQWLTETFPQIKIAALTMNDTDMAVLSMIQAGCCSYLLKNMHPTELEKALTEIADRGYYNSNNEINFKKLMRTSGYYAGITDPERQFLKYACTDFTYSHIATLMNVSGRTIESYRASIFVKLNVQSRTGMAMEALRRGLVDL